MDSRLCVYRRLPDGRICLVKPFHVSLEGLESALICRDEEDCDVMVKNIFLSARRNNVIVVIYGVVSNHAHIAVLASDIAFVEAFANDLKKVQSMWIRHKYGDSAILLGTDVDISEIDTIQYARNAFAYIPRNALDNGAVSVSDYKWTGFRGMFCKGEIRGKSKYLHDLSVRKRRLIMHTCDDLDDVQWKVNDLFEIEPASACDWKYLEGIYNCDCSFWLRMIGSVNTSEMEYRISESRRRRMKDSEFYSAISAMAKEWYGAAVPELTMEQKSKMVYYLNRKYHLSVPQASRCMGIDRETMAKLLGRGVI